MKYQENKEFLVIYKINQSFQKDFFYGNDLIEYLVKSVELDVMKSTNFLKSKVKGKIKKYILSVSYVFTCS